MASGLLRITGERPSRHNFSFGGGRRREGAVAITAHYSAVSEGHAAVVFSDPVLHLVWALGRASVGLVGGLVLQQIFDLDDEEGQEGNDE